MPVVRVPLVGSLKKRNADKLDDFSAGIDQSFVNCSFQVFTNPVTGERTVYVKARPKFTTSLLGGGTTPSTAVKVWTGNNNSIVTATTSTTNSTIYSGTSLLGTITGKGIFFSETTVSEVATLLVVSASNRAYYYPAGGSLTEITDTDFPPKQTPALTITGNFAHKDGVAYIMCTNGQIWNSDLNSVSGWSANAFISAQERPDGGIGLARYGKYIVGFGSNSTEFFENSGNPVGSPMSRVAMINIGVPNQYCIVQFRDTVAFIGCDSGSWGVYLLNGTGTPQKISPPDVNEAISVNSQNLRLNVMAWHGRAYLIVSMPSVSTTDHVCIDVETGITGFLSLAGETEMTQSDVVVGPDGYSCYYIGENSFYAVRESQSSCPNMFIQTAKLDFGSTNKKQMLRWRLIGESQSSASVNVNWTNDDYSTQDTDRTVTIGSTAAVAQLNRMQMFRRRAFYLTLTNPPSSLRLEAMEIDYEEAVF